MADDWATARFTVFTSLSLDDTAVLRDLIGPVEELPRGHTLRREGSGKPKLYLLHRGWVASSNIVAGARQLLKVYLPGDLLGVPSLALTSAHDTLRTLSDSSISVVEPAAIGSVFERSPRLAALLFLISQDERIMLMDRLASFGQASAVSRIATAILQLHDRVLRNKPEAGHSFHAPLTQKELGDLAGITQAYVNRSLRQLSSDKVVSWRNGVVTIHDRPKLQQLAGLTARRLARETEWLPAGR